MKLFLQFISVKNVYGIGNLLDSGNRHMCIKKILHLLFVLFVIDSVCITLFDTSSNL